MTEGDAIIDCEAGRRLGCRTFCCRLLVRLDPDERDPGKGSTPAKGFVDKDPVTGLCAHFDPESDLCRIWEQRPRVCREYTCNTDPLLQVVLRHGFRSLAVLVRDAAHCHIPPEEHRFVPCQGESGGSRSVVRGKTKGKD